MDSQNVTTSPPPAPEVALIKQDLANLNQEFFEYKLAEYIDIYCGNHAMLKSVYYFEKYIQPEVKKRCNKWCDNFNDANHALQLITKKKEKFIPVKDEEMIEL